ncbi:hypothetical protein DN440_06475 [Lactobacillus reuteri]|nr:hypothetical protein [Limosilactobacillus reuteri]
MEVLKPNFCNITIRIWQQTNEWRVKIEFLLDTAICIYDI